METLKIILWFILVLLVSAMLPGWIFMSDAGVGRPFYLTLGQFKYNLKHQRMLAFQGILYIAFFGCAVVLALMYFIPWVSSYFLS